MKVQRPRPELPGLLMAKLCAGFQGEADAALGHKAAVAERKASGGGGHGRWHRQWCSTRSGGSKCSGKNARDVIPTPRLEVPWYGSAAVGQECGMRGAAQQGLAHGLQEASVRVDTCMSLGVRN